MTTQKNIVIDYRKSLKNKIVENTPLCEDVINIITEELINDKYTLEFCQTENYRLYNIKRCYENGIIGEDKLNEIIKYQDFITKRINELEN